MKKHKLGSTGYEISSIGLGTVQFGVDYGYTQKKTQQEVNHILQSAWECGINMLDTASEYGDSEKKIGIFMAQNDAEFVIFTKLKKIDKETAQERRMLEQAMNDSVEHSLENLQVQTLDFLLLHQAETFLIENSNLYECVHQLKKDGLIRGFGISVYEQAEVTAALEHGHETIDFFQFPYNIFDQRFRPLSKELKKKNIGAITRSAFLKGIIPSRIEDIPDELEKLVPYKEQAQKVASQMGITVAELALLFVTQNENLTSAILGVDSAEELKQNVDVINKYEKLELHEKQLDKLEVKDVNLIDPRKWKSF